MFDMIHSMPRAKTSTASRAPDSCALVPTESPVFGVNIEVGILLVQAVKARRVFLSKSSSTVEDDDAERESSRRDLLRNLHETADDKDAIFLNELKRQVQSKSSWSKSASRASSRRGETSPTPADAPVRCVVFLLEILSDASNSFHLRRSALASTRQILVRSSAARAYFACGRRLLNFARMAEGGNNEQVEDDGRDGGTYRGNLGLSPKSLFRLEAMELVHELASEFGEFYTRFCVASRLLGDSSNSSMHNIARDAANGTSDAEVVGSTQRDNVRELRRERDAALENGPRACLCLERMVERADEYFRILVPRFGGFNAESLHRRDKHTNEPAGANPPKDSAVIYSYDSKLTSSTDGVASNSNKDGGIRHDEHDDGGSIDWEEGDIELLDNDTFKAGSSPSFAKINADYSIDDDSSINHQVAVTQTLEVMERSGALLEGTISIQIIRDRPIEGGPIETQGSNPVEGVASLRKLQNLVDKFSRRLPHLNRWICALAHADGMEERTIVDPITARPLVSLMLLSEENRALRTKLLQRFMKLRGEIEGVLQSSSKLGINLDKSETKMREPEKDSDTARVNGVGPAAVVGMKRDWMSPGSETTVVSSKRKKHKTSRFNIIYQKN